MSTPVILTATHCQQECARHLAQARLRGHDHCRKKHESLGSDALNKAIEFYGVLAEVCVFDALERQGFQPEYVLLTDRAPKTPDFMLGGLMFDIKSSPPGKQFLCISERQRRDQRRKTHVYLPVAFLDGRRMMVCRPILPMEVAKWSLRSGHEPYRSIHRDFLSPLSCLEELFAVFPIAP